ncbi:unnamed protein product [Trichobilharzia szidati]|nr:unnamed protein product [Trichobilharzia szidati]
MCKILIELLKHFPPNFILDELWICMKNANFRIRTNSLYSVAFILRNSHDEGLDLPKILQRITQCLKDRSGVVQTAAIECCAILIGLHNRNYPQNDDASLLYAIENFLLEEMPVLEVDFLLQKIRKAVEYESFKENFTDENDSLELEISERQKFCKYANSMRSAPSYMKRNVTFPAMVS